MGGPRLELFRFASYVFLPVAAMAWYGNPEWYEKHVKPLRDGYLQPEKADVVRCYSDKVGMMFVDSSPLYSSTSPKPQTSFNSNLPSSKRRGCRGGNDE